MVRGAVDVGQGVAALVAQHMPMDTTPSVSSRPFSVKPSASMHVFGAAPGTGDIPIVTTTKFARGYGCASEFRLRLEGLRQVRHAQDGCTAPPALYPDKVGVGGR